MNFLPDVVSFLLGIVGQLANVLTGDLLDMHVEDLAGWDVLSTHIIKLNNELGKVGISSADALMGAGKALGAIFALIVAAQKAYKMMTLEGKFEVLEIARPVLFAFLIANSGAIVEAVTYPGTQLENHFRQVYEERSQLVAEWRKKRSEFSTAFNMKVAEKTDAAEQVKKSWLEQGIDWLAEAFDKVQNFGATVSGLVFAKIFGIVDTVLVFLGELFFQIGTYFIFFIKALFITVLTLFGPIQLACSILPSWKDAWASWIGRLVAVSLYGAMAYIVMTYTLYLLQFAYEVDCEKLNALANGDNGISSLDNVFNYVCGLMGSSCTVVIAYLCGGLAMSIVPELASWCIPGGSASMGASNFIGGMVGRTEGLGKKALAKA